MFVIYCEKKETASIRKGNTDNRDFLISLNESFIEGSGISSIIMYTHTAKHTLLVLFGKYLCQLNNSIQKGRKEKKNKNMLVNSQRSELNSCCDVCGNWSVFFLSIDLLYIISYIRYNLLFFSTCFASNTIKDKRCDDEHSQLFAWIRDVQRLKVQPFQRVSLNLTLFKEKIKICVLDNNNINYKKKNQKKSNSNEMVNHHSESCIHFRI